MYDNPIYRWRASIAVALSELRDPPLGGYLAYGSIVKYLNEHGLALMEGEASPMPSYQSVVALAYNSNRLNRLFKEASTIPINYRLPPVPIVGSEKGEAAFYYLAFRLFGIQIKSIWLFYFTLLGASTFLFSVAFWRSPICMLLLMLYLSAHFYMTDIATISAYQTVHNSRFLPVLAVLPSMHLALLILRRTPFSVVYFVPAIGQTFLLFFVIFCRVEAAWQPAALLAISAVAVSPIKLLKARSRSQLTASRPPPVVSLWPAALLIAGAAGFVIYGHIALDHKVYSTETRTHTFWDPLIVGTISANPELNRIYGMGQPPYSDTMGYFIARKYLVEHNDATSPIAIVKDGVVVGARPMENMGAYDAVLRRAFFQMAQHHPWLTLRSILYDKPRTELSILLHYKGLYRLKIFSWTLALSVASATLVFALGALPLRREHLLTAWWVLCVIAVFSLSTTFIYPTTVIPDAIIFFLLVLLMTSALLLAFVWTFISRIVFGRSSSSD
jgi:hypothetical protein